MLTPLLIKHFVALRLRPITAHMSGIIFIALGFLRTSLMASRSNISVLSIDRDKLIDPISATDTSVPFPTNIRMDPTLFLCAAHHKWFLPALEALEELIR